MGADVISSPPAHRQQQQQQELMSAQGLPQIPMTGARAGPEGLESLLQQPLRMPGDPPSESVLQEQACRMASSKHLPVSPPSYGMTRSSRTGKSPMQSPVMRAVAPGITGQDHLVAAEPAHASPQHLSSYRVHSHEHAEALIQQRNVALEPQQKPEAAQEPPSALYQPAHSGNRMAIEPQEHAPESRHNYPTTWVSPAAMAHSFRPEVPAMASEQRHVVAELQAQAPQGLASPFALLPAADSHFHGQEADIILTPDFSGMASTGPMHAEMQTGQDLTGDQHLTAQPLSQRATHAAQFGQPIAAPPPALVSAQPAPPVERQESAALFNMPSSHHYVPEPQRIDRALSRTQQMQNGWDNHLKGITQPHAPAQGTMLSTGWGQENLAPQASYGADGRPHSRSLEDILGRANLHGTPAETLNLPHLKVMESFLQRHGQEQGRLHGHSPSPPGWLQLFCVISQSMKAVVRVSHVRIAQQQQVALVLVHAESVCKANSAADETT